MEHASWWIVLGEHGTCAVIFRHQFRGTWQQRKIFFAILEINGHEMKFWNSQICGQIPGMKILVIASFNEPVMACVMSHVPMLAKSHDRRSHARTTLMWTAFVRWVTLYELVFLSKDTLQYYSCRRFDFKSSRPDRSKVGRVSDSVYFHFPYPCPLTI